MAETFNSNSSVRFTRKGEPETAEVGRAESFGVLVELGEPDEDVEYDFNAVKAQLFIAGSPVASDSGGSGLEAGDRTRVSMSHVFELAGNPRAYPRTTSYRIEVEISGEDFKTDTLSTEEAELEITNPIEEGDSGETIEERQSRTEARSLGETYDGFTPFSIENIAYEDDASTSYKEFLYNNDEESGGLYNISFEYPNPSVSIDGAGKFATQDIIGGTTVKQKVGEEPLKIDVTGVCKRRTANQIDSLRDCISCQLFTDRIPLGSDSILVQIGSTSTSPMDDGGVADLVDGQFLYSFKISATEIEQ